MKKLLITLLVLAAFLCTALCIASPFASKRITGSGTLTTQTMAVPDFDGIDASRGVKVIVTDKSDKIIITADDNLIDYVVVKTNGRELKVTIDSKINSISNPNVTVSVPSNGKIRSLDTSSGASITTAVGLTAREFEIDASSGSKIEAAIKADKVEIDASSAAKVKAALRATSCTVEASSAAKISLTGSTDAMSASASSGSKIDASEFTAKDCNASASSGSKIEVNCTTTLDASASSGAHVGYTGACNASISKSSGGRVSKQ